MVGSGKSTTAATVAELLSSAGFAPQCLRFRYLGLFGFAPPTRTGGATAAESKTRPRAQGFELRPLTAALTAGYLVRIIAFRLSGIGRGARCDIVDRYFYDNLVHYALQSRLERLYARILQRLIPQPDLAILLLASDATIAIRRDNYDREYIVAAGRRYRRLPELFPQLTAIYTDSGRAADDDIRRAVHALLAHQHVSAGAASHT